MSARTYWAGSRRGDQGFSMVELLVVIIIIGILAAIAVPMYVGLQAKAYDSAAKQDVTTLATAVRDALDKRPDLPTITWSGRHFAVDGTAEGAISPGVVFGGLTGTDESNWCVDVTHPDGNIAKAPGFRYSAAGGLEEGQC